jgi:hypothetical protein
MGSLVGHSSIHHSGQSLSASTRPTTHQVRSTGVVFLRRRAMATLRRRCLLLAHLATVLSFSLASTFQSGELVLNDDEFKGIGARPAVTSPS